MIPVAMIAAAVAGALASGCRGDKSSQPILAESEVTPVKIERLDLALESYAGLDSDARKAIADSFAPGVATLSLAFRLGVTGDSALTELAESRAVKAFGPAVNARLGSVESIEPALTTMLNHYAAMTGGGRVPRVFAVISPFRQSVMTADSVVLIALNHYLGPDFEGYEGFADYERRLKTLRLAVPDVAEALLVKSFPYEGKRESTVLSRLLYEGALVNAKRAITPEMSEADAIGVTEEELKWLDENEPKIWQTLIERNLLYSTDPRDAERLVLPGPGTPQINTEAPGRTGRYIGYRIVQSFLENEEPAKAETLLKPDFYDSRSTLPRSKYSPARR